MGDPYPRGDNYPTENMQLIAEYRTLAPALAAEVERLRARVGEYEKLAKEAAACTKTGQQWRKDLDIAERNRIVRSLAALAPEEVHRND